MASTVMHPKAAAGPGRSERRNVDTLNPPPRDSAKAPPVPTFPASAGPIPRSLTATQPHRDSAPWPNPQHSHTPGTHRITSTTRFNP